ncbi:hypothetical protein [Desulfovibrio sp. 3_1_syn3]|uniref:hypothetical protein n=1 Tax=Desulfovibrio sp. 3_1_syn3 TaxID=457398 RepID=UPI0001E12B6C|nr:hypothetical protein [Desulfovibrio sp. 3_1_syn3]
MKQRKIFTNRLSKPPGTLFSLAAQAVGLGEALGQIFLEQNVCYCMLIKENK